MGGSSGSGGGFGSFTGSPGNGGTDIFDRYKWFNGKKYQGPSTAGPRPDIPERESIRDASGSLKEGYFYNPKYAQQVGADRKGLDALTNRALATGDSPWLKMMNDKIGMEATGMKEQGARDAMTGRAGAMDAAAMRGGLTGGGAARLAGRAQVNEANAAQMANRFGAEGRINAGLEDERTKLEILQQLPQHEMAFSNQLNDNSRYNAGIFNDAQRGNVNLRVGDVDKRNAGDVYMYGEAMKGYGADRTADATAKAGKKGMLK